MIDEDAYLALAQRELSDLVEKLDQIPSDSLVCELSNDIITIEFSDDTTYIINSHRAARQIWMAAEHTAWHFDWDSESEHWIAHKTEDELWATLEGLLRCKLPKDCKLERFQRSS